MELTIETRAATILESFMESVESASIFEEGTGAGWLYDLLNGGRDDTISENRPPITVPLVRGPDNAAAAITGSHQLEEDRGAHIIQRQVANLIDDQHLGRQVNRIVRSSRPSR
jgi:hypothetical protein